MRGVHVACVRGAEGVPWTHLLSSHPIAIEANNLKQWLVLYGSRIFDFFPCAFDSFRIKST